MSKDYERLDPTTWRPQAQFRASIGTKQQLNAFNESGGIAVYLDVTRLLAPDIEVVGSQSSILSFWDTRSSSGFVTKPKFSADLLTLRFVTSGHVTYLRRDGKIVALPSTATMTGFDDLLEVCASGSVSALSATIPVTSLASACSALTGEAFRKVPIFEPLADLTSPGMQALFCTVRSVQHRLHALDHHFDSLLPLLQELVTYQVLSAWPKRTPFNVAPVPDATARGLRLAIDYIEANLVTSLTLAEVAAAAGVGVRALQMCFKKELGRSPLQFIIERRLTRAHEELISTSGVDRTISDVARSWGFIHISDFGQRYRRMFGYTPSQTRSKVERSRRHNRTDG